MNKTRLVGLLFAATVLFQMPMMKLGSDKTSSRPFTPITTVAAQMVLAVEDTPDAPGDPGDAVRALLFPGRGVKLSSSLRTTRFYDERLPPFLSHFGT